MRGHRGLVIIIFSLCFFWFYLRRVGFLFARCLGTFSRTLNRSRGGLYGRTNGTGVGSASWLVCSGRVGENLLGFFLRYIKLDIYCQ